jgi:hypothetical protein
VALALAACGRSHEATRLRALVIRPPHDTVRFETAASAGRCAALGLGGLVLQGTRDGNGVVLWLRFPDSLASGDWPLLQRADTTTLRGAIVGVRFMAGDVAHGAALDSGAVAVTRTGATVTARVRASGLEVVGATRVTLDAAFQSMPLDADTVPCRPQP